MRAIVYENGAARYDAAREIPKAGAGESLIRIHLAAICNTDREILRGYRPQFCGVMGHEFVGTVESGDDPALVGKRVVGELNINCGHCLYCDTGRPHHCLTRRVPGLERKDGCFADYMVYPNRMLHIVPDGLPDEAAVFCEPLAAALQIAEQCHMPPSERVAVLGDGRLALMVAQAIAANGTGVTVFGRHAEKLTLFKSFAETALQPAGDFETVVDTTGNPEGLLTAIGLTRSGGRLVLKSTYAGNAQVNMSEIVVRELTVVGSRCGPFSPALQLLERGQIVLPELTLFAPDVFEEAFAAKVFKAGFDFRK